MSDVGEGCETCDAARENDDVDYGFDGEGCENDDGGCDFDDGGYGNDDGGCDS